MPVKCAWGPYTRNEEPKLDDVLTDPIVQLPMAGDRVSESEVRRIASEARQRRTRAASARPLAQNRPRCRTPLEGEHNLSRSLLGLRCARQHPVDDCLPARMARGFIVTRRRHEV